MGWEWDRNKTWYSHLGFPCDSNGKESAWNTGDLVLIPGLGRSPGKGNICLLQYSCLENSMDRGAWQDTDHWVTKSDTTERLTLSLSLVTFHIILIHLFFHPLSYEIYLFSPGHQIIAKDVSWGFYFQFYCWLIS